MQSLRRLTAAAVLAAALPMASAFHQPVIGGRNSNQNMMANPTKDQQPSSPSHRHDTMTLMYRYNYPPFDDGAFDDPYFNPHYQNVPPPYYNRPPPPMMMYQQRPFFVSPMYALAFDADAEIIAEDEEFLDDMLEEEEWMTDRQRAQMKRGSLGEVIELDLESEQPQFDPDSEQPANEPLKSAAAYPSDVVGETVFQGRKPGQAVNRNDAKEAGSVTGGSGSDPREQYVVLDDYDEYTNDFFRPQSAPPRTPQRSGPSVYTPEEEDLIASMGGRDKSSPQPPPMPPLPGRGGMPPQQQYREEGYLGDSTLKEISLDYAIPIPYLADVIATWGVPVPIDPNARLGDMVTGEQAFAILEAIHTLDIAALHERYSEETLMNICDYYDVDIKEAFEFCVSRGWALPFGVRTFLRVEQEEELLDVLG